MIKKDLIKMNVLLLFICLKFTGSQESILHLDMDDNGMNSESRETDSPVHDSNHHSAQAQVDEHPQSSVSSSFPSQHNLGSIRKPSLISLVNCI